MCSRFNFTNLSCTNFTKITPTQKIKGPSAPPNSATSSFDNSADLFPSSQESASHDESYSDVVFGLTDISTPESASTSDDVFDSSAQKKSPSHSPSY